MAKYRYPYQKIVDLKTSEKTQAEWMLSAAVGRLQAEERTLSELLDERAVWTGRLHDDASAGITLSELQMIQTYIGHLDTVIWKKREDIRQATAEVDRCKTRLTDRMVDEKVWLKAKEKAFDKFKHAMLLQEQNELDEIASVRFALPAN